MAARPPENRPGKQKLHDLILTSLERALEPSELSKRSDGTLQEMAHQATLLAEHLPPGEFRVHVSNPSDERAGRTVIEVLVADQPFLVDTLRLMLDRLALRELLLLHPLLAVERDEDGSVARCGRGDVGRTRESYLYVEVSVVEAPARRKKIEKECARVLGAARNVVSDHAAMLRQLRQHVQGVKTAADTLEDGAGRVERVSSFLDWLTDDNFVFFGYRSYQAREESTGFEIALEPDSGLGILRDTGDSRFLDMRSGDALPELIRNRLGDPRLLFLDKSRAESVIHRHGRLDSISVKQLDDDGKLAGFGRFVGLLTHTALRTRPSEIPILEQRRLSILEAIGAEPGSHTYKAAAEAYNSLPIEFLFSSEISAVTDAVQRILNSAAHRQVEVFVLPDRLQRSFFVSVILPRPLYDESLRGEIHHALVERHGASYVDHRSSFLDDEVALIHFFCSSPEDIEHGRIAEIEADISARASGWESRFEHALLEAMPAKRAYRLAETYLRALPQEYRHATSAVDAVHDVECLEHLEIEPGRIELRLERRADPDSEEAYRLKLFLGERPYLTDLLPVLDHLGLQAIDAKLTQVDLAGHLARWIVTFRLEDPAVPEARREATEVRLLDALRAVFERRVEDDLLNGLILSIGLDWCAVDVLRAYLAYADQLGNAPSQRFAAEVLARYPEATRALRATFDARFDPALSEDRSAAQEASLDALERARGPVATASEDRVFSILSKLICATTRHSFFRDAAATGPNEIVFKIDGSKVEDMPQPRPFAEIFVHSAEMIGVHLRGGRVARGGLRWSDRPHDLRTEILGLMKTQMVKNGLIVPVGSKGGFALKRILPDAAQARAEADRLYERFVTALLSLTDNSVDGIEPPEQVVRHDGDDPYLVVAADKGTAHLSDVANGAARKLRFWLDDAFASGGSHGYDHKKEGITAWGAWICARLHFLELDVDVEQDTFTVVGIGDMSGDVFGNGLLFARRGRLQVAFNHMHVFLDPDPDPEIAWRERKRLFELPRSSWKDYASELISEGGGVFDRSARRIDLSPKARRMLDVSVDHLSGEELVRAALRMPVDLLWNGGIGTYVKAAAESHADVGDRANENVRVNGAQLRARVVAEGGNLGFTQLARIEYAHGGGRINTDAIDNSGGVDLSDHEVNFKILAARACMQGRMSTDERNTLLAECVGDADAAVLAHNGAQSRVLSLDQVRSWQDPERMMLASDFLVEHADLVPALEFLPDREGLRARAMQSRQRAGYTRPELAILLGYTKMLAKRELVASDVPDLASLQPMFHAYFPEGLRRRLGDDLEAHPLRREITATCLTNHVIDRAGVTLVPELAKSLSVGVAEVIAAYHTAETVLTADELRVRIESVDAPEGLRVRARLRLEEGLRLATTVCLGLQRRGLLGPVGIERFAEQIAALRDLVPDCLAPCDAEHLNRRSTALAERGLEAALAEAIESLPGVVRCFEAVSLSLESGMDLRDTVERYAHIGEVTRIVWLLEQLAAINRADSWTRLGAEALYLEMLEAQRRLTRRLAARADLDEFARSVGARLHQIETTVAQIEAEGGSLSSLIVLSQQIRRLC